MLRRILAVLALSLLPGVALAACPAGVDPRALCGLPAASSPLSTDVVAGWQYSAPLTSPNKSTVQYTLGQIAAVGGAGTFLPLTGGTLTGGVTGTTMTLSGLLSAGSLSATGAATVGGTLGVTGAVTGSSTGSFVGPLTIGPSAGNQITLTGGATSGAAATIGASGTGGITSAAAWAFPGNVSVGSQITLGTSVGPGSNTTISTPNGSNIVLNPQGAGNVQILSPLAITGATSITANPVSGAVMGNGLSYLSNLAGTITSGNTAAGGAKAYLDTASDTLSAAGLPAGQVVSDLEIDHNFGGTGFSGTRAGLLVNYSQTAAVSVNTTIEGAQFSVGLNESFGGTGLTPTTASGYATGINPYLSFGASYTNGGGGSGEEIDVQSAAASTFLSKGGLAIVETSANASQGAFGDNGIVLNNQYTQASGRSWKVGIAFGNALGFFPLDPLGTMIGAGTQGGTMDAAYGINLSNVTFSTASLALPGFTVNPTGNITITTPATGTAATFACFTTGGALISSAIAC